MPEAVAEAEEHLDRGAQEQSLFHPLVCLAELEQVVVVALLDSLPEEPLLLVVMAEMDIFS